MYYGLIHIFKVNTEAQVTLYGRKKYDPDITLSLYEGALKVIKKHSL